MSDEFKERKRIENIIHWAMVDWLSGTKWKGGKIIHRGDPAFLGLRFYCIYNEIRVDDDDARKREGYFRTRAGVRAGVFDLCLQWPWKNCGYYDVKAPGEHLSPAQNKFASSQEQIGFPTSYGSSLAHLRDTMISWGAKCINPNVIEPDLRSKTEQRKDAEFAAWGDINEARIQNGKQPLD